MGVAHEGAILTAANFSGNDDESKKKLTDTLVEIGALKPVPLTDAEKEVLAEAKKEDEARIGKEKKALAEAEEKTNEILEADFDEMNKDPMIQFAKDHGIELKSTLVDDIREELKALQESLTAPE